MKVNNPAQQKSVEELDAVKEIQVRDDIKVIAKTPEGIRFFKYVVEKGSIFTTTFTGNSNGHFLEGKRAFALDILDILFEVAPETVPQIILEDKAMVKAQRDALENSAEEEEGLY